MTFLSFSDASCFRWMDWWRGALLAAVVVAAPLHGLDEYDVDGKVYLSHARDSLAAVLPIADAAAVVDAAAAVAVVDIDDDS